MDKLFAWLRAEPVGPKWWLFVISMIIVSILSGALLVVLLGELGAPLRDEESVGLNALERAPFIFMFIILPILALAEELIFRLPLVLFIRKDAKLATILALAIALSVLFGRAHGSWWQVFAQGVTGFIFCLVFLKGGGLKKKYGKALFSSTAVHLGCNWFFFGCQLLSL